jgi:hypothetical protein
MEKSLKEILAGQGIGDILFGITRDELLEKMGEPDEREAQNEEAEGIASETWHYDDLELSFSFDEADEWRLVAISGTSEELSFRGKCLIGMPMDEVLPILEKLELGDADHQVIEEFDSELMFFEEDAVMFWFDNKVLTEIQWTVFADDESALWPEV